MNNNILFIYLFLIQFLSIWCDNYNEDNDWDVLVFTQRWPLTVCSQWIKENSNHSCRLPDYEDIWTVHGIWPTKSGTRGPWNCDDTWKFNESAVAPIESDLQEFWINIEKNTALTSLWEHEWKKHGTCAAVLPQLNNELKFFKQGLEWIKMFNMKSILLKYNIIPSLNGYEVENIFNSIKNVLNHDPVVQCVVDKESKETLISEIQICFDRSFNLIDCDPVEKNFRKDGILTDCSLKKKVFYPNKVLSLLNAETFDSDKKSSFDELLETRNYWISIYKTIKFLIWATI
ncbi:hypothetical protein RN001_012316 [Aquatica leii]|uniref:Uncharacterized protein n=1 Tax=Aquatica leii TaxID=1421715 RepID=A0AAN7SF35_9COLE|nr:hypothetical protein RN001_012316 [Aquatica leii]